MNTTFDFKRFSLLMKRHFIENRQRELTSWGMVIAVFAISCHNPDSWTAFFLITGVVLAARTYKQFAYTPSAMHYLLIPATHFEKLIAGIITSTLYFCGMVFISSAIGITIGNIIANLIWGTNIPYDAFWMLNADKEMYIAFLLLQAIFLFGSLFFKSNALGKTLICLFIIVVGLGLLEASLLKAILGNDAMMNTHHMHINVEGDMFPRAKVFGEAFIILLIPFFWVVSYFRLNEKQV